MELTKEEKKYILYLIDRNTEAISHLEGAISDDDWIYETYDMANSIKEKFEKDEALKESNNVEEYNSHFGAVVCKLTPEEYDAVKRYFK